ncbi:MAG: hypothetical protein ABSF98_11375 [Bryobacteraceae bacterium]
MVSEDFAKFVESQQAADVDTDINWSDTRDEWLKDLDDLYQKIVEFLQEYIANHSITYSFTAIDLTEENIGTYSAKRMDIKIGRQIVSLVPVGTVLIGCRGRVDVEGAAGTGHMLLVNKKARNAADLVRVAATVITKGAVPALPSAAQEPIMWVWRIVTNAVQKVFEDLNKESFLRLVLEIANA